MLLRQHLKIFGTCRQCKSEHGERVHANRPSLRRPIAYRQCCASSLWAQEVTWHLQGFYACTDSVWRERIPSQSSMLRQLQSRRFSSASRLLAHSTDQHHHHAQNFESETLGNHIYCTARRLANPNVHYGSFRTSHLYRCLASSRTDR